MKRLALLAAALAAAPLSAQGADYDWPLVRVIDGDTVLVDASADMPPELAALRVRLRGVDAPEIGARAGCGAERELGAKAKALAEAALTGISVTVRNPEWGRWGGRVIADLILPAEEPLAESLLLAELARPWAGGEAAPGWCGESSPAGEPEGAQ